MDYSMQMDTLWVLLGAALIFFMQAGFAMVETGFTRAKNAGNIIMKNLMDFAFGSVVFWLIGYGLMQGQDGGVIGSLDIFPNLSNSDADPNGWANLAFNTMFCATAATIVSGAMAERTKFKSYLVYSILISAFIYPIASGWVWGGGWLHTISMDGAKGYNDYAGSTVVHMIGGLSALIGAKILGPRIGKYDKNGKAKAIPGHSLTLGALGVFILWFGWFGFNPASSYGLSTVEQALDVSNVFMTTNIAAACATIVTMIFTWVRYGKPDVSMTLNGSLAGLVAITAGCSVVDPWAAAIIGCVAGILVVVAIEFIDKKLKIDDPVGAVGVHGANGLWGGIACGLFNRDTGLFTTGHWGQLVIQLIGAAAILAFVGVTMTIVFLVIKKTIGLRVSPEEEIAGLDIEEHGLTSSYADFLLAPSTLSYDGQANSSGNTVNKTSGKTKAKVDVDDAVPVELRSGGIASDVKLTKLAIICKQNKFEELKAALNSVGVMGITVTQVLGCGVQKGNAKYYRGVEVDVVLLPKVKVEVVVSAVPVRTVIDAAKKALYTGNIGDGKIFVYDVENVVKVRTGEEGFDALQGVEDDEE